MQIKEKIVSFLSHFTRHIKKNSAEKGTIRQEAEKTIKIEKEEKYNSLETRLLSLNKEIAPKLIEDLRQDEIPGLVPLQVNVQRYTHFGKSDVELAEKELANMLVNINDIKKYFEKNYKESEIKNILEIANIMKKEVAILQGKDKPAVVIGNSSSEMKL